jgi:hypothetical protein
MIMPNRLALETSPYLLQHADNPVDWYPWGDEAFALAREDGKPVLLSIGYSACHWCHVMAHESFEDETTAELMNELFVNIKVDREERPDVDKIYQVAQQLLTQRTGGWPLTMFLNPDDQRPFFGGTYFPNEARYGMPAFSELLKSVATYFREQREQVVAQGDKLTEFLSRIEPLPADNGQTMSAEPLSNLRSSLATGFDSEYGGFGGAPKFPHPTTIERLLRHWRASANSADPDVEALYMATLTLARMAAAIRSIVTGRSRISRRCCTTTVHCLPFTPRHSSRVAIVCSPRRLRRQLDGCCPTCSLRRAAFTRLATLTRKVKKVFSTCGLRTRHARSWGPVTTPSLLPASAWTTTPISKVAGT